jgi:DNA-binding NarL/FixJ family response regulator
MDPIRVLLISGNGPLLDLIRLFLEQHKEMKVVGICVEVKTDLTWVPHLQPDVVICDLGTPGLTGLEIISGLHAMMPEVGIVATSLLGANGYREVALSAGADAVIPQTQLNTCLLPAVERAVKAGRSPNGAAIR